jgi:hypothetical protein
MDRGKRSQKSSSKYWCVVPGCTSDSRKKTNLEKYPWMENNVTFIPFPTKLKNHRLRSKWIEMIRRPLCYQPLPRLILLDVPYNTTMSECLFPSENLLSSGTDLNFGCSVAILNKRRLYFSHMVMEVT